MVRMVQEQQEVLNDRYKLLERAGSGGMAIVYRAQDLLLGRIVAIKVLQDSLTGDEAFLNRFQQEAHAAANLTHPHIVTVHDIGQDGYRHYIVMEYVAGQTLKQIVRAQARGGRHMPINRALDLTIQICSGIGYAHRAGLVHCDVKPQNVLVTRDERVKVADFGIARAMSQASGRLEEVVWGTPHYFSPEQAAGQPATPASDVYAIGVILFELLTGRLPFTADSPTALALKHLRENPPSVSRLNPAVPEQLDRIVAKVLSKEPAGRYRTGGQLGRILSTYRQSSRQDTVGMPAVTIPQPVTVRAPAKDGGAGPKPRVGAGTTAVSPPPRPTGQPTRMTPVAEAPTMIHVPTANDEEGFDWFAVALGIIALVALLGLIPLWYFVFRAWTVAGVG